MVYDVFISFKNSDANGRPTKESRTAKKLYDFLTAKGLRVFFSNVELEFIGKAKYTEVIDEALDSSGFLIAVGSSHDNLNSQWVRYEWESFLNDIRSGIKPNAEVFGVYEDMKIPHELPRALRQQQSFSAADSGAFETLYNFIKNSGVITTGTGERKDDKGGVGNHTGSDTETQKSKQPLSSKTKVIIAAAVSLVVVAVFVFGGIALWGNRGGADAPDAAVNGGSASAATNSGGDGGADTNTPGVASNVGDVGASANMPGNNGNTEKSESSPQSTTGNSTQPQSSGVITVNADNLSVTHPELKQEDYSFEYFHTNTYGLSVVRRNEWLYYCGFSDDSHESTLYKMKINGEELTEISKGFTSYPMIWKDHVYFTDFNRAYRLFRTDGINPVEGFLDENVGDMMPTQNGIYIRYYYGPWVGSSDTISLYDYNGNRVRFEEDAGSSGYYTNSDYLFYTRSTTDFGLTTTTLHRMDFDGKNKIELCEGDIWGIVGFYDSRVYFRNGDDGGKVYSVSIDGGVPEDLGIGEMQDKYTIDIDNSGSFYYYEASQQSTGGQYTVRRFSLITKQTEDILRISNVGNYSFSVMGDWIFIGVRPHRSDVTYLCRLSTDGTQFDTIAEFTEN